jgi:hypothetical protein
METNNNNINELEQMREQMNIFKSRLDQQQIINEQLVRNSMGGKLSWIKSFVWGEIIIVPIFLLLFAPFHAQMGLSWWLFAFLAIGLIADAIGDFIINRIPKSQLLSGDLVETSQRLVKMKKQRTWWFVTGLVFVLIWFVWFCAELIMNSKIAGGTPGKEYLPFIVFCVIGGIIGAIIAWLIFRKMQKTNNQLIEQINQVTQEM